MVNSNSSDSNISNSSDSNISNISSNSINSSNSIIKLKIFQEIIQKSGLFRNLTEALLSLRDQLTNNDETNVKIIEDWIQKLPEDDKKNILQRYEYLSNVEMFGRDGTSSTKPGEPSKTLKEAVENAIPPKEKP